MESDWPKRKQKSLRHINRFLARVRRRYFLAETSDSRKYVCIRRLGSNRPLSNFIRKINGGENVSCLVGLALRLHYTCLVWQWISSHK